MDTMLFFPEGSEMIFGEGHRVYPHYGRSKGYNSLDIGYVNDLFMGGLIYTFLLYGTILKFILKKSYKKVDNDISDIQIKTVVPIFLCIVLLLSNYKGESMRGGVILLGVISIKLILMQS